MEVSERGLGGESAEVEFLEGMAWYCVGMLSWVNVGLAFFGDIDMLEISERGFGGAIVVVEFFEVLAWYCVDMVLWFNVGLALLCKVVSDCIAPIPIYKMKSNLSLNI